MKAKIYTLLITTGVLLSAPQLQANDFKAQTEKLCEKMRSCALQEIEKQGDLMPQVKEMVVASVNNMCTAIDTRFEYVEQADKTLVNAATKCMESMTAQSCDVLMSAADETPACKHFQKVIEQHDNKG